MQSFAFIGCFFLLPLSWAQFTVYTAELAALSDSGVSGTVTVFSHGAGLSGAGTAKGLEASLSDAPGANCTAKNGCGVHVHSGTGCASDAQGGHYYSGASDPWVSIRYSSSNADGTASFNFIVVDGATSIEGKPFIIHNNAGGRVACGILSEASAGITHTTLAPLSDSSVHGSVTLYTTSNMVMGAGFANGLEASLSDTVNCTAKNGCGAHVHSGTACTDSTTQGGHYYKGESDPWANIRYSSTSASGVGHFVFMVEDDATDVAGKAFIVHNDAGGRVTCGLLKSVHPHKYKVYAATLTALSDSGVSGEAIVFAGRSSILGVGTAKGLEASLSDTTDCTAKNGCGVHVHSGTACTDSSTQGGHYYLGASDPWKTIGYSATTASGDATFRFALTDDATGIEGKPFIIHNNAGGRVACGKLSEVTSDLTYSTLAPLSGSVNGAVTVYAPSSTVAGAGFAVGLEPSLSDATNCTAKNGCGAHVHSGTACTDKTTQGGHYYNGADDPWANIRYSSTNSAGVGHFVFHVADNATDVAGKPFIVHNDAGGRVSCGLLAGASASGSEPASTAPSAPTSGSEPDNTSATTSGSEPNGTAGSDPAPASTATSAPATSAPGTTASSQDGDTSHAGDHRGHLFILLGALTIGAIGF